MCSRHVCASDPTLVPESTLWSLGVPCQAHQTPDGDFVFDDEGGLLAHAFIDEETKVGQLQLDEAEKYLMDAIRLMDVENLTKNKVAPLNTTYIQPKYNLNPTEIQPK